MRLDILVELRRHFQVKGDLQRIVGGHPGDTPGYVLFGILEDEGECLQVGGQAVGEQIARLAI